MDIQIYQRQGWTNDTNFILCRWVRRTFLNYNIYLQSPMKGNSQKVLPTVIKPFSSLAEQLDWPERRRVPLSVWEPLWLKSPVGMCQRFTLCPYERMRLESPVSYYVLFHFKRQLCWSVLTLNITQSHLEKSANWEIIQIRLACRNIFERPSLRLFEMGNNPATPDFG